MSGKDDTDRICRSIAKMSSEGAGIVVVHGGGPEINAALEKEGITPKKVNGLRITDDATLEVVEKTLRSINESMVSSLTEAGAKAIGMPGYLVTQCKKKEPVITDDGPVDLMYVGDVVSADVESLEDLIKSGVIPVIFPVGVDAEGNHLNINADSMASGVAAALKCSEMVQLTDVPGIMIDVKDPSSKKDMLTLGEVDALIENGTITGGMIPKVEACRKALDAGVEKVRMFNGKDKNIELSDIVKGSDEGTVITKG